MIDVFIVEDHLANLEAKAKTLGHEVVGKNLRAIEALVKLRKANPDIILEHV